jgi:hypothetical protein
MIDLDLGLSGQRFDPADWPRALAPRPRVTRMSYAAAEQAQLTGQVRSLLAWIGDGRKLTQTSRLGLADARRLVESLPKLGKPMFPRNTWRQSIVGDDFTDIGPALLTTLLRHPGACPLAELNGTAYDMIAARYVLARLPIPSAIPCGGRSPSISRSPWPPCMSSATW